MLPAKRDRGEPAAVDIDHARGRELGDDNDALMMYAFGVII
jgi:hypothetical protein